MLNEIQKAFKGKRIVIAGDLVADQFLHGTISRVSREAPVFILKHDQTDTRAGAAANAAVNVASLGGVPHLIGLVGSDESAGLMMAYLAANGVDIGNIVVQNDRRTTTKVRVLAGQHYAARQQVIRIDYDGSEEMSKNSRDELIRRLTDASREADAIILSDYSYGVVNEELFQAAHEASNGRQIPLVVDSRFGLDKFRGATSATPNQEEVEQLIGPDLTNEKCEMLRERLEMETLLVTRGNQGMLLFEKGKDAFELPAVGSKEPVDVTGAGDTVIATFALALAAGIAPRVAARVANHAGGIVVMKKGTASVTIDELVDSIKTVEPTETFSSIA
ncbi:MAG TPA: PfkB family carbohydrate kinase [Pyrinomonadaceae bacterium]|nr:PfkB family carbohydrate kinase [Pyrinomonadaceae bacterium]